MEDIYLEIIAILILILANGFFSLAEFSIIASRASRLKRLAKERRKGAGRALKLHSRPETFLATVQVGITFVAMLAGVFSGATLATYLIDWLKSFPTPFVVAYAEPIAYVIVALLISFFSVVIGELVPKYLALSRPHRYASLMSAPISLFIVLSYIPVKILTATAKGIIRLMGVKTGSGSTVTEDEINLMIAEGREKGVFDATEEELISSVFDFSDITARQAMTPRTDIIGIEASDNTREILKIVSSNGFSRYPVYEESMDNITGIIYAKDVIRILQHTDEIVINDIVRKPLFVPDSMMLNILLRTFQQKRVHMAVVLDEFGGTAGLITLEDILEEIVGEIHDEFDTDQKEFVLKSKTLAFAAGSLRPDELNDKFETDLPENESDTIGGLIFERLGRPAEKGEDIIIGNVRFKALEVDGHRIQRLRIEKFPPKSKS